MMNTGPAGHCQRSSAPAPAWLLLAALALGGCLVSPVDSDGETVQVSVSLDAPGGFYSAPTDITWWDSQGLFRLGYPAKPTQYPKLLSVSVAAPGKSAVTGTWPDPKKGLGSGEGQSGEVQVDLTVPSGPGTAITALGWLAGAAGTLVYKEEKPGSVDLVAGKPAEVSLNMVLHATGTMEGTVRCKEGNSGGWAPGAVSLVDAEAMVLYPATQLVLDGSGNLTLQLNAVPVGRAHWFRVHLYTSTSQSRLLDLRSPTYKLAKAGEKMLLNLAFPCSL